MNDRTGSQLPTERWYEEHWDQINEARISYRTRSRWPQIDPRALALIGLMVAGLLLSFVL
jgi:hypothetical protein